MNVSAKDKATGKSQSVKIEASTTLSKDEIEKLRKEAAEHATEDAQKKERAEVKNQAESTVYLAEKAVKDAGDKLPADVKKTITEKIEALKNANQGTDTEAIKTATSNLSTEIQKIGQTMYGNQADQNPANPASEQKGPDGPSQPQQ